jgi:hypothetical protein
VVVEQEQQPELLYQRQCHVQSHGASQALFFLTKSSETFSPGFSDQLPGGAPPSSKRHGTIQGGMREKNMREGSEPRLSIEDIVDKQVI